MPTYQYVCEECHHAFEVIQSITEEKLRECPQCHALSLTRQIGTGGGIIFKGTGFYETDYKRPAEKKTDPCPAKKEDKQESCACQAGSSSPASCQDSE